MKLQKGTLCLQAFIVKRVFIFNSIAFKTGHYLEMYSQCTEYFIEVFCHWEQDIQSKNTLIKPATYFTHEWSCKKKHFVHKHSLWRECLF